MMKRVIYFYNAQTKVFDHSEILMDDKAPVPTTGTNKAGEALGVTTVKPADGLYTPIIWNGNAWLGTDEKTWQSQQEERQADQKANPAAPTAEQQMINALGLQVASLQATVTKLTTTNGGAA